MPYEQQELLNHLNDWPRPQVSRGYLPAAQHNPPQVPRVLTYPNDAVQVDANTYPAPSVFGVPIPAPVTHRSSPQPNIVDYWDDHVTAANNNWPAPYVGGAQVPRSIAHVANPQPQVIKYPDALLIAEQMQGRNINLVGMPPNAFIYPYQQSYVIHCPNDDGLLALMSDGSKPQTWPQPPLHFSALLPATVVTLIEAPLYDVPAQIHAAPPFYQPRPLPPSLSNVLRSDPFPALLDSVPQLIKVPCSTFRQPVPFIYCVPAETEALLGNYWPVAQVVRGARAQPPLPLVIVSPIQDGIENPPSFCSSPCAPSCLHRSRP